MQSKNTNLLKKYEKSINRRTYTYCGIGSCLHMFVVPRQMYGIRLLMGCEVNILDNQGNLDLNDEYLDRLDIAIAGIHGNCWQGGTKEENTKGMLQVIRNPKIHIISHPGDGTAELDFEPLVLAAKEFHTLLEINTTHWRPNARKP